MQTRNDQNNYIQSKPIQVNLHDVRLLNSQV